MTCLRLWQRHRHARLWVLVPLLVFWLVNIWSTFAGSFCVLANRCKWPEERASTSSVRLLVVADPQLSDRHSQGYLQHAPPFFVWLFERTTDSFMKRAFRTAVRTHKPDGVVLLGDLMDFARRCQTEAQYERLFTRFSSIFLDEAVLLPPRVHLDLSSSSSSSSPSSSREHNIDGSDDRPWLVSAAGNHDVGYWEDFGAMRVWADRFRRHFGPLNRSVRLKNGLPMVIVASTYLERRVTPADLHRQTSEFIDSTSTSTDRQSSSTNMNNNKSLNGTFVNGLLISHVPLDRPGRCLQSKLRITNTARETFRNRLTQHDTHLLLAAYRPAAILSGDFHHSCQVLHGLPNSTALVPEHTVPTFSWVQGEIWPGYALVSLSVETREGQRAKTKTTTTRFKYRECTLPPQLPLLIWHGVAAVVSVAIILLFNVALGWRHLWELKQLVACFLLDAAVFSLPVGVVFLWHVISP